MSCLNIMFGILKVLLTKRRASVAHWRAYC